MTKRRKVYFAVLCHQRALATFCLKLMASTHDEVLAERTPLLDPTYATDDVNNEKTVAVRSLRFWLLTASYSSIVLLVAQSF